jgi:hypothetical protein
MWISHILLMKLTDPVPITMLIFTVVNFRSNLGEDHVVAIEFHQRIDTLDRGKAVVDPLFLELF